MAFSEYMDFNIKCWGFFSFVSAVQRKQKDENGTNLCYIWLIFSMSIEIYSNNFIQISTCLAFYHQQQKTTRQYSYPVKYDRFLNLENCRSSECYSVVQQCKQKYISFTQDQITNK